MYMLTYMWQIFIYMHVYAHTHARYLSICTYMLTAFHLRPILPHNAFLLFV